MQPDDPWIAVRKVLSRAGYVAVTLIGLLTILSFVGIIMENHAHSDEEYQQCLKQAANGYEVERCR